MIESYALAEQFIIGKLDGELITDQIRTSNGYLGCVYDGYEWQTLPPGWWAVAVDGQRVETLPPSIAKERYGL